MVRGCHRLGGAIAIFRFRFLGSCSLVLFLGAGCATYKDDTEALRASWSSGHDQNAATIADKAAHSRANSVDAVIWQLEAGAAYRGAGRIAESIEAFAIAAARMAEYDEAPDVSLSAETAATLTNLSYLPYRGRAYDKVMLTTYQALNYMQLGEMDAARVALNQAMQRQREAVAENAKRIETAQQAARESAQARSGQGQPVYNVERTQRDPSFQRQLDQIYANMAQIRTYGDYVNPFTVLLDGLFFMYQGVDFSDWERARVSLNRVRSFVDYPETVDLDLRTLEGVTRGEAPEPVTYILFETGMAPIREEVRIDIPLFIVTNEVPYVGVAFPRLEYQSAFVHGLRVRTSEGVEARTVLVCSMDSVITREFENDLPVIITRTLLSAGTKALIQYGIRQAVKDQGSWGALVQVAGIIYQASMNQADLRTWVTLPKQFQYTRVPTPADGRLELIPTGGTGGSQEIELEPGWIHVVYVKSNSSFAPLTVRQFVLKKGDPSPSLSQIRNIGPFQTIHLSMNTSE